MGEEYQGVEVATATVRARRAGEGIVREAKRRGVEAMKTSACSIPASTSASISSAVPIVKRPPASSQPWPSSTSSRSCESGSSSSTETVWPARSAAVATEDPTLPAPTTSTNIGADSN